MESYVLNYLYCFLLIISTVAIVLSNLLWMNSVFFFRRVLESISIKSLLQVNQSFVVFWSLISTNIIETDCWSSAVCHLFTMPSKLGHSKSGLWFYQKDYCCCSTIIWSNFTWIFKLPFCHGGKSFSFEDKVLSCL